jgi:hypothetical protein
MVAAHGAMWFHDAMGCWPGLWAMSLTTDYEHVRTFGQVVLMSVRDIRRRSAIGVDQSQYNALPGTGAV